MSKYRCGLLFRALATIINLLLAQARRGGGVIEGSYAEKIEKACAREADLLIGGLIK